MATPTVKTVKEALKIARKKLSSPDAWTKMQYAVLNSGECPLYAVNEDPVKACAIGWLEWATGIMHDDDDEFLPYREALTACIPPDLGIFEVEEYNDKDQTKHEDIIAMYDCAIAKEESTTEESNRSGGM